MFVVVNQNWTVN